MTEIAGIWMDRSHTRIVISRDGQRSVLALNINDTSSHGAPDVQVLSTGDAFGTDDWDELYPETDFG